MFDLFLAFLGTYYITYSLTQTDGPVGYFEKLSRFKYSPISCFTCTAVWSGLFMAVLLWLGWEWAIYVFALAGAAQLAHNVTR